SRAFGTAPIATPPSAEETRLTPAVGSETRQATVVPGGVATVKTPAVAAPDGATGMSPVPQCATVLSPAAADAPVRPRGHRVAAGGPVRPAGRGGLALAGVPRAAAAAGGFLAAPGGGKAAPAALANQAPVRHLHLSYPTGWQLGAASPPIPGIAFTDPLVLS